MGNYHNKAETKRVGEHIKALRKAKGLNIEDVATLSGFTRNTIKAVEAGNNTDTSHLIEIAKAIGVHPRELFDIPFDLKPRFKLSPKRLARNQLTSKISQLIEDGFFASPRLVNDVLLHLEEEQDTKALSIHASVVLKRMVEKGELKFEKQGRQNLYYKKP